MANKPFCILPFVQFSTTVDGSYQACCIANKQKENIKDITPMDFFNGEHMKQLRWDMLQSGEPSQLIKDSCYKCIENEKNTGNSKRLQNYYTTNDHKKDTLKLHTLEKIAENKDYNLEPTDMDSFKIKIFGNLCNLKCTMCNPMVSSKIAAESKKLKIPHNGWIWEGPVEVNPSKNMNMDKFREDLKKILPTTKQIEIVGGEPLLYPETFELVNWIVENDLSKNLDLRFVTNGMTVNMELFTLFKYFKQVVIMYSIDGVGKVDEYIRTGTKWEEKVENMRNSKLIPGNIKLSVSTTIQMLNIGYLSPIDDFCKDVLNVAPRFNNPLSYPKWARAVNVPSDIKQKYLKNYSGKNFINKRHVLDILENEKERDHDEFFRGIKRYKMFDKIRKTNLLDIYPEFERYYNMKESDNIWSY